jgi:hypothetical protein
MKVLFKTIPNHVVSSKERKKLQEAFDTAGIEMTDNENDYDIALIKSFSNTWDQIKHLTKPKVLLHIGINYGLHQNLERDNEQAREIYEKADAVVYISDFAKLLTEQLFPKRDNPLDRTIYMAGKPNLPEKYFGGYPTCVTTGIWREWKRREDSIALAKKEKFKLIIIGGEAYKDGNIECVGWKDDFEEYYHNAHIFLNPSLHETLGNVTIEAMQHGLPVLCTNHGATKELVKDAGIVIENDMPDTERPKMYGGVNPVDLEKFSWAYYAIMHKIDYYRQKAKERVQEELNAEVCGRKFKQLFESCLH